MASEAPSVLRPPGWRERLAPGALLRGLLARRGSIQSPLGPEWQPDLRLIRQTRRVVPILMNDAAALQIILCARAASRLGGSMAEAGVFMGGSARLICAAKASVRLHLFDIFETLQLPALEADAPAIAEVRSHFGPIHGRRSRVETLLGPYPDVHFHEGFFPGTTKGLEQETFCFVHLDLDLEASTMAALEFFHPRMVAGGILIGDDYEDEAVRQCFARYFCARPDTMVELPWGQVMIIKQGAPER
jgi:O-methyltransferase